MRAVNVAELQNRLSKYPRYARGAQEVAIRDRAIVLLAAHRLCAAGALQLASALIPSAP